MMEDKKIFERIYKRNLNNSFFKSVTKNTYIYIYCIYILNINEKMDNLFFKNK